MADIREMDGEQMQFTDGEFDFVWSWGVIHHSAHTDRIVREVARVLRPGGEFRAMVYNRHALCAYTSIVRGFVSGKYLQGMSVNDVLSFYTDGYLARHYSRSSLARLLDDNGLATKRITALGLTTELIPIPGKGVAGRFKSALLGTVPDRVAERALQSVGSLLFAIAAKPARQ